MSAINYLTLVSTIVVTSSGTPVPPGYINIASTNSAPSWSNSISTNGIQGSTIVVSSINGSTITTSTLSGSTLTVSTFNGSNIAVSSLNTSTLSGSTITGSTLTASIINVSTLNPIISNVSSLTASTLSVSTMTGSTLTASIINVSTLNPIISNVSSLTASTLSVSTMTGSTLTISRLTGLIISVSSITSSDLVLSTLTVSSINGLVPGTGSGGSGGNVSVGTTVFSTLGVSSLNATSTITTSTLTTTSNVGIGTANPQAPLHVYKAGGGIGNTLQGEIRVCSDDNQISRIGCYEEPNGTTWGGFFQYNGGGTDLIQIGGKTSGVDQYYMAIQRASGNIGIGTTNPSHTLQVAGPINCTSLLVNGTAVATGTGSVWGVNGSSAHYTSGNVGIGTVSPSNSLTIYAGGGAQYLRSSSSVYTGCYTEWRDFNATGRFIIGCDGVGLSNFELGAGIIGTWSLNSIIFLTNAAERLRITSTGNVGIGITNPSVSLHVNGATFIQGSTVGTTTTNVVGNFGLRVSQLTSTQNTVGQIVGQMCFHGWGRPYASSFIRCITDSTNGWDDAGAIVFGTSTSGTGAVETMRISEAGYVGIGTASPSHPLQVAGAINCTSLLVNGVAVATGTGSVWGVSGSTAYYTSGNVGIGTASPTSPFHIYALQSTSWPFLINYSSGIQVVMGNGGSSTNFMMDTYNSTTGGRPALCLNVSGGFVGIGTTTAAYPTTISNSGFINLEINRTAAGTNFGSGIVHSLTSSTGSFRGEYAYAFGGATTIATSAQSQAFGYYGIDLANAGIFGVNTGGYSSSHFFMTTSSACFPKTNVGIGTASPISKLHVYSTTANDGIVFRNAFNSSTGSIGLYTSSAAGNFIIDGTADAGIVLPADGKDLFLGRTTSLYTSMVVKGGTGYVGIGIATPTSVLTVNHTGANQTHHLIIRGQEFFTSGFSNTGIALNIGVNRTGNKQLWIMDPDLAINSTNTCLRIVPAAATTTINCVSTNGGNSMPLTIQGSSIQLSGGNVGIGTAVAAQTLSVYGTMGISSASGTSNSLFIKSASSTDYASMYFSNNVSSLAYIGIGGTGVGGNFQSNFFLQSPSAMAFNTNANGTNGTNTMYLTATGNVGIGNVSPNTFLCVGSNGGVNQSTNIPGISMTSVSGQNMHYSVGQGTAGTNNVFLKWVYNATASSGYGSISCYGGNNSLVLQEGGGNVGIGTLTPGATLHIYSATADYTNSFIINTAWPSIRLGSSSVTGRDWVILNGGSGAGIGVGNFGIFDITGNAYRFSINSSGNVSIPGTLSKGGGTFDIQHPLSSTPTKRLVHSFIEGPRCDLIYRGKKTLVNGSAIIDINKECTQLPECAMADGTFEALCANIDIFLQNNTSFSRIIGSIIGGTLTITCENTSSNDIISWMVVGERVDPFIKQWDRTDSNGYLITEYTTEIVEVIP